MRLLAAMRFPCLDFDGAESSIPVSSCFRSYQDIQDSDPRSCYHGLFSPHRCRIAFYCFCCLKFLTSRLFPSPFPELSKKKIFFISEPVFLSNHLFKIKLDSLLISQSLTTSLLEWLAMRLLIRSTSLSLFWICKNTHTSLVYPSWRSWLLTWSRAASSLLLSLEVPWSF